MQKEIVENEKRSFWSYQVKIELNRTAKINQASRNAVCIWLFQGTNIDLRHRGVNDLSLEELLEVYKYTENNFFSDWSSKNV